MVITKSKLPVKTTVNDIQIFNPVYDISCIFQDIFTPGGGGGLTWVNSVLGLSEPLTHYVLF